MRTVHCRRIRRLVEGELVNILKERYALETDPEVPIRYYLDFKSDERLLDLRNVLERLERGTYGKCISCSTEIRMMVLTAIPETRFCEHCQRLQSENAGVPLTGTRQAVLLSAKNECPPAATLKAEGPARFTSPG